MVIVYTTIFGGSDSLKPAPVGADRCVCFTDVRAYLENPVGWDVVLREPPETLGPRRAAWHVRCLPHHFLDSHAISIWIDASFAVTNLPQVLRDSEGFELSGLRHHARSSCYEEGREVVRNGQSDDGDVARQLHAYSREGFQPSTLTIGCLLVRSQHAAVIQFNERWDAEIQKHQGDNCQLSLDYAAWKSGLSVHHLQGVRKDNPYALHDHADHKRRRKPYQ